MAKYIRLQAAGGPPGEPTVQARLELVGKVGVSLSTFYSLLSLLFLTVFLGMGRTPALNDYG